MHDLMVKFPASWPEPVVVIVCMVVLAALDFLGALAAAEGLARRSNVLLVLGAISFVLLFWFYASSLQYAELAVVTFGWIVLLQISLLLLDRIHYGISLAPGKVGDAPLSEQEPAIGRVIVHDLMVKFPASWPDPVVVIVCMVVLAALDFLGALAAAEGLARRSNVLLVLGAISFVASVLVLRVLAAVRRACGRHVRLDRAAPDQPAAARPHPLRHLARAREVGGDRRDPGRAGLSRARSRPLGGRPARRAQSSAATPSSTSSERLERLDRRTYVRVEHTFL